MNRILPQKQRKQKKQQKKVRSVKGNVDMNNKTSKGNKKKKR